ncbi:peptidylprolyl isomerase [Romboutsia sp.]|uniref:peptidylprolyl isomerase n=1 Tax=Romboutsia sp. TaxID=1965302 RepID=UPI003F3B9165
MSEEKNKNNIEEETIQEKKTVPEENNINTILGEETDSITNNEEAKELKDIEGNKNISKKNKNIKAIVITAVVGIVCLGVGFTTGKEAGRKLPATWQNYSNNKVVATVGDTQITEKDLSYRMEPLFYIKSKEKLTKDEIKAYESSMIDYITTTEVLYLEGRAEDIKVSEDDVTSEYSTMIASLTQNYGMTEEDLINKFNIPKDTIRKNLEKELIATKYLGEASDVSDKEAENYYNKNKEEFLKVKASHILIKNTDDEGKAVSDEQKKKNKEKAEEILKQAKEGVDFATLAKEYSDDSSAQNGGDLGLFSKGQMVQAFEDAAFGLKVGDITDKLVETEYGYHIIKKTDETYDELDDVKEELKYNLSYQKQSNIIEDLTEKYNVTVK